MLSFFPALYPDELLYSWFARYHLRSSNVSPKLTMTDLFDSPNMVAVPDLPNHLNSLYYKIKHFEVPDVRTWILKHTFFNYYTAFGQDDIRPKVFDTMISGSKSGSLHMMAGIMASNITEPAYFRYCQLCVDEDIRNFGETYWHLSHQMPGVLVCFKHTQLLRDSNVHFRGKNKHNFEAATIDNCRSKVELKHYYQKTLNHLINISSDIIKLVQSNLCFPRAEIQQAYKYLLQEHGFATVRGKVNQSDLAEEFISFYGADCLSVLQSPVDLDNPACWLKSITRKHRKSFHPIRHLLFIRFLGEGSDALHQLSKKTYQPFGPGPYPCLNAAALHYLEPVISQVIVTICTDTRRPVGTFPCSCGFTYSRRGPDLTYEDLYKIGRIKQFGYVWEEKLKLLVHQQKLSFYAAAKELNVDIATVKKYASKEAIYVAPLITNQSGELSNKQSQWLQLQVEHPNLSKTQLRKMAPALYSWLYRNAHNWLVSNSPSKLKTPPTNKRVDWKRRDVELLTEIDAAVESLKSQKKPVHINISRIGKEIGKLALLERHLDKLPKTASYLKQIAETRSDFQIRRVHWSAQHLFQRNEDVVEWKISKLAGLKTTVSEDVKREIKTQVRRYLTKFKREV